MMPDATMVKITMKSILAALVINNQHLFAFFFIPYMS